MITAIARKASNIQFTRTIGRYLLSLNQTIWDMLPKSFLKINIIHAYGRLLHRIVQVRDVRNQNPWTYFARNRDEMDLVRDIIECRKDQPDTKILVLACSVGMEVFSIKRWIKTLKVNTKLKFTGLELSAASLEVAKRGEYPLDKYEEHLEKLGEKERSEFFYVEDGLAKVHPELKKDIKWIGGNACAPDLVAEVGEQDIVLANRFLCHMYPEDAENCLDKVKQLVAPGGYLFVTGLDLEVRKKIMSHSGFTPVFEERVENIHNGDYTLLRGWPWNYWGLEPYNRNLTDAKLRYAMVWQRANTTSA